MTIECSIAEDFLPVSNISYSAFVLELMENSYVLCINVAVAFPTVFFE